MTAPNPSDYVQAWVGRAFTVEPSASTRFVPSDNLAHALHADRSTPGPALCGKRVFIDTDKPWPPRVVAPCPECARQLAK